MDPQGRAAIGVFSLLCWQTHGAALALHYCVLERTQRKMSFSSSSFLLLLLAFYIFDFWNLISCLPGFYVSSLPLRAPTHFPECGTLALADEATWKAASASSESSPWCGQHFLVLSSRFISHHNDREASTLFYDSVSDLQEGNDFKWRSFLLSVKVLKDMNTISGVIEKIFICLLCCWMQNRPNIVKLHYNIECISCVLVASLNF